jgi:hypothetical protein
MIDNDRAFRSAQRSYEQQEDPLLAGSDVDEEEICQRRADFEEDLDDNE